MKKKILAVVFAVFLVLNIFVSSIVVQADDLISDLEPQDEAFSVMVGALAACTPYVQTIYGFALAAVAMSDFFNGGTLGSTKEVAALQMCEYWSYMVDELGFTEYEFTSYWEEICACAGNSSYYFDGVNPVTDEQMAVVNAYGAVLDTVANGVSLDELVEYIYHNENDDTVVNSTGYVEISGETFSEICDRLAGQYAPKADTEYISWKQEKHPNFSNVLTLYTAGTFCNNSDWYECYAVPFYFDGEQYYYGYWQYHFYQNDGYLNMATYNSLDVLDVGIENYTPVVYDTCTSGYPLSDYRYVSVRAYPYRVKKDTVDDGCLNKFYFYSAYSDYVSGKSNGNVYIANTAYGYDYGCDYMSADMTTTICPIDLEICDNNYLNSEYFLYNEDGSKDLTTPYDIGYFVSNEYIEMGGLIDPIPVEHLEDTTVTLAGDTIYDYTITNNTTGDTSTVNYFVTNNYTYENSGGSSGDSGSSDGGSTSGDFNVGGKVDVSGDIEVGGKVDININVEQGSGSTEDIKGYEYEEVNLEEALEQIPEMSTGFTNWFSRVFAFLPPELMGLLLGGISIAILLRIAGR